MARALENAGFVQKDPLTLRYQVGSSFEDVALNGLRNSAAHGARRKLMNELAERLGARVNLVVLKAGNLSFVQWVESTAPLRVDIKGDMPMPVHCTASGKLLLAFGPAQLREMFFRSAPFRSHTKTTITTARGLAREFEEIRKRGYSTDDQELLPGVNCLAVPVCNRAGQTVAGLAVMAPVASLPLEKLTRHLPDVKACAARISVELGWQSAPSCESDASAETPCGRGRFPVSKAAARHQFQPPSRKSDHEILRTTDVQTILKIVDAAEHLEEIELVHGGFRLHVVRSSRGVLGQPQGSTIAQTPWRAPPSRQRTYPLHRPRRRPRRVRASSVALSVPEGVVAIRAPMLGVFYRASAPGEKPFVEVGQRVRADDTVCLIEVMKLFNSIRAGVDGEVVEDSGRQRQPR